LKIGGDKEQILQIFWLARAPDKEAKGLEEDF